MHQVHRWPFQWPFILGAFIAGLALPYLVRLLSVPSLWRILLIYVVFNSVYALVSGRLVRQWGIQIWVLSLLPIFAALATTAGFISRHYGYYFALLYLVLALLTFLPDTRDDVDEDLLPLEND